MAEPRDAGRVLLITSSCLRWLYRNGVPPPQAVDDRWLKRWCMLCLCDTHSGRGGLGTCVCPRGKSHWENCCRSRGAVSAVPRCAVCHVSPCRRGLWGVTWRWCMSPAPYETPFQKAGRWRRWAAAPTLHRSPPGTRLFRTGGRASSPRARQTCLQEHGLTTAAFCSCPSRV